MKTTPTDPIISQIVTVKSNSFDTISVVVNILLSRGAPFAYAKPVIQAESVIAGETKSAKIVYSVTLNDPDESLVALFKLYTGVNLTVVNVRNSDL